ncbi:penicillin-binding transpeptidase domain-containing protein [Eubacteriaceae bacterium ES3]|nr:penicillin-binding transpeptidase domain-containing protein [Eubacteriaceae bacterium ES3]
MSNIKKRPREIRPEAKQNKILGAMAVLSVCLLIVIGNLFYLQIVSSEGKYERQVDQLVEEVAIKASRGDIYDRNGNVLAKDSSATALNIIPYQVEEPEQLAKTLADNLGLEYTEVLEKLSSLEDDIVEVKSGISSALEVVVMGHNFDGVEVIDGTLYVVPDEILDPAVVAAALANDLEYDYESIYDAATRKENQPLLIKSKVDNSLALAIKNSEAIYDEDGDIESYNGVELLDDYRRYYTNGNFASYILGFTGSDYTGLYGVEATYDDVLSGEDGVVYYQKDADGNQIASQTKILKEPVQGEDITLTVDSNIQLIAEKAVEAAAATWQTTTVTAIIMDTDTGEVLAMATTPDYNLNDPYTLDPNFLAANKEELEDMTEDEQLLEMYQNPGVSFIYEPGSTFKAITGAAALEEGVVTPDTTVYDPGYIQIGEAVIHCATGPHYTETVSDAIATSCNPGLVQIIEKLDPDVFYQYVYNFGFGKTTGIELTGEEAGIINRLSTENGGINEVDYATFSFGQGLATTPIQMITALNSVVNDGYYVEPTIISAATKGEEADSPKQIISTETSSAMREIMRKVVLYDSSMTALSEGYSIGGKTGTAEKFIDGEYSSTKYVTSFYCFAPVEDPQYSVYVVLDEPKAGAYGSTSAAPTAISLMKQVLDYNSAASSVDMGETQEIQTGAVTVPDLVGQELEFAASILAEKGIPYTIDETTSGSVIAAQSLANGTVYDGSQELVLALTDVNLEEVQTVVVPDLKGLSIQSANELLTGLGLNIKISGSGFASSQTPAATTVVEKGSDVTVFFSN